MSIIRNTNPLMGTPVSDTKFQGVTSLGQIRQYGLLRPSKVEGAKPNSDEAGSRELHDQTNRKFVKSRMERAVAYAGYIEAVEYHGRLGGTPAITLFHEKPLEYIDGTLQVPYGTVFTAIDGETQTEARYILEESKPESVNTPFAITVYHGMTIDAAKQILHDYNAYANPVKETATANFNNTGQLTIAVRKAIAESGVDTSRINLHGATSTKKTTVASRQVLVSLAGYQLNGQGSLSTVSASQLKHLNMADSREVAPQGVSASAEFIRQSFHNPDIGKAAPAVWQIAGVLVSKGRDPKTINWVAGIKVYNDTKSGGRGGSRMSTRERLALLESVM